MSAGQTHPKRIDYSAADCMKSCFWVSDMQFIQDCRPGHHNSISHSIFRSHIGFQSGLCRASGLAMWWSANRCNDQYITNRTMGNGAGQMVVSCFCMIIQTADISFSYMLIRIIQQITPLLFSGLGQQCSPKAWHPNKHSHSLINGMTSLPM